MKSPLDFGTWMSFLVIPSVGHLSVCVYACAFLIISMPTNKWFCLPCMAGFGVTLIGANA